MRTALWSGLLAGCVGMVLAAALTTVGSGNVQAQDVPGWEYGYLLEVDRVDTFRTSFEAWSASRDDKDYLEAHVFAYERGFTANDRILNRLRRMNELAEEGWALYDEQSGLLMRRL